MGKKVDKGKNNHKYKGRKPGKGKKGDEGQKIYNSRGQRAIKKNMKE
jgi:hypothetical protein